MPVPLKQGQTINVVINFELKTITWMIDLLAIAKTEISKNIKTKELIPYFEMYDIKDSVRLLNE